MPFELTVLGSSSATPTADRHPSAQILNIKDNLLLIDCGEATQNQLLHYRIRHTRIKAIFITHLHADHFVGIFGLLATINFHGREDNLKLYAPSDLKTIIDTYFKISGIQLKFQLDFISTDDSMVHLIADEPDYQVHTVPLKHRLPTTGFIFTEKRPLKRLKPELCEAFHIPFSSYQSLKEGKDYVNTDGNIIQNYLLTEDNPKPRSYAYMSDTLYLPQLAEVLHGVNLLYHESTFMHELLDRANETLHTTAKQAGMLAKAAGIKRLLLGHYSARYRDLTPLLFEAQKEFENTLLAIEGEKYIVD